MKKFKLLFVAVVALPLILSACGDNQNAASLNESQSQQVKDIVRQMLMQEPKIIIEAVQAYQEQSQREAAENSKKALQTHMAAIYQDPKSPFIGNATGDVTVVEFFDYNCGYCKQVFHPIRDAVLQDGKIKFVFKEYPILGESSVLAAKAALAAHKQGKYIEFHTALMDFRGNKDDSVITKIATDLGLNVAQLKTDMASPEIEQALQENFKLAQSLNINGTPGFIIGDKMFPGALDADSFKKHVATIRSAQAAMPSAPETAPQPN